MAPTGSVFPKNSGRTSTWDFGGKLNLLEQKEGVISTNHSSCQKNIWTVFRCGWKTVMQFVTIDAFDRRTDIKACATLWVAVAFWKLHNFRSLYVDAKRNPSSFIIGVPSTIMCAKLIYSLGIGDRRFFFIFGQTTSKVHSIDKLWERVAVFSYRPQDELI